MSVREMCLLLGSTEAEVTSEYWETVQSTQRDVLADLRERTPLDALQKLADFVYWSSTATECVDAGLLTGPRINLAGAEKIIAVARERGLVVPLASPGATLFGSES